MQEYASNSHKSKESNNAPASEKRVEKVVSGNVNVRKKSSIFKLAEVFLPEDVSSVKDYILTDVVVPAIKDGILNSVTALLYGNDAPSSSKRVPASRVSYRNYYESKNTHRDISPSRSRIWEAFDCESLEFNSSRDAYDVIAQLDEIKAMYPFVRVADFYDAAGVTPPNTAYNYGWTDIQSAKPVPIRGGKYIIKMPRALPID